MAAIDTEVWSVHNQTVRSWLVWSDSTLKENSLCIVCINSNHNISDMINSGVMLLNTTRTMKFLNYYGLKLKSCLTLACMAMPLNVLIFNQNSWGASYNYENWFNRLMKDIIILSGTMPIILKISVGKQMVMILVKSISRIEGTGRAAQQVWKLNP